MGARLPLSKAARRHRTWAILKMCQTVIPNYLPLSILRMLFCLLSLGTSSIIHTIRHHLMTSELRLISTTSRHAGRTVTICLLPMPERHRIRLLNLRMELLRILLRISMQITPTRDTLCLKVGSSKKQLLS